MIKGTQIGAYRVVRQIGAGGMGSVWLARHAMLGRRAAIKVLHPEFSRRPVIVQRFFNEARAATDIVDPGIVQIFDFGFHVDGSAYIVMELLDGESLARRLARRGPLKLPEALRLVRQVASSLGAAHARGIIHRDLKPGNIFVVRDPEVAGGERAKILDFGIAKLTGEHVGVHTRPDAVIGTPSYMSPEQCRGAGFVDQRSDVYALGCMLFRILVGHPPFHTESTGETIALQLHEPPAAPSSLRPELPPEVDQLVLRCLAKDPAQRYAHGGELASALDDLLRSSAGSPQVTNGPIADLEPSIAYEAPASPTTLSGATVATVHDEPARRPRRIALLSGIGLGVAVGAVALAIVVGGANAVHPPASLPDHGSASTPPATAGDTTPTAGLAGLVKRAMSRFVAWSGEHATVPVPSPPAQNAVPVVHDSVNSSKPATPMVRASRPARSAPVLAVDKKGLPTQLEPGAP